jgi:fibronectin type 3 domain-containing protein
VFDPSTARFEDTDLKENTTYYYKIYVYNSVGKSKPSNEVELRTRANMPPTSATLNRPLALDNTSVELSWLPSQEQDFSMYRIYRSERSPVSLDSPPVWMNSNRTINKYKDTGLTPGKTYHYKVVVYDKGGLFAESNEVSVSK